MNTMEFKILAKKLEKTINHLKGDGNTHQNTSVFFIANIYYVSFIDDYSRKTWVYFLKSKDKVFSKFKEFKALIENLSERKIKILRSNNGGEYTSKEFVNLCKDVGIKRELTTPYNPQ
jgi:transposase InsO family protein